MRILILLSLALLSNASDDAPIGDLMSIVNVGHGCPSKQWKCARDCKRAGYEMGGVCFKVVCFCVTDKWREMGPGRVLN